MAAGSTTRCCMARRGLRAPPLPTPCPPHPTEGPCISAALCWTPRCLLLPAPPALMEQENVTASRAVPRRVLRVSRGGRTALRGGVREEQPCWRGAGRSLLRLLLPLTLMGP